ncbi:delta(14)-sterol reductase TM7SF2 [Lepeophtheirus salmonis]|uniref:delta(14)-sterol reductase TM7SF2 n=1 Tax=Lepeophtheirus salmonis TaxID=72036 RepID=UPI001AE5C0E7|nr:delta(14)-sterol reductase LBR-like [Lepeophtheirus salmonis]
MNHKNSIKSRMSLSEAKAVNNISDSDDESDVVTLNTFRSRKSLLSLDTPTLSNHVKKNSDIDTLAEKIYQRTSARIASKLVELSSDDERPKLVPNPDIPLRRKPKTSIWSKISFEWLTCLFFMILGAFILFSLHLLCKSGSCKPAIPKVPQKLKSYWDPYSVGLIVAEILVISLLSLIPIGPLMTNVNGQEIRKNGFLTILACFALLPILVMKEVDLELVNRRYFRLMISSFSLGIIASIFSYAISYFFPGPKTNKNSRGNTGNIIVDLFHGRELNPTIWKFDLKLQTFRFSMISLALINAVLIGNYVMKNNENASPLVICAAVFQIIYAFDALFFEDFYFFSHDAMNNGYGYSMIVSYYTLPFLPTLIVRYLLAKAPIEAPWYVVAGIVIVNMVGYIIFRASENQRCLFKRNPDDEGIKHLERITSGANKKILSGSWWSLVRYPNYLGEVLIQWSWVLPAVTTAGKTDLLIYYLPMFITLVLLVRCSEQNARNRQMYGNAWDKYCQKVRSNIFPKIY